MDLKTSSENFSCFYLPYPLFDGTYERFITNLITAIINIITTPFALIVNILIFVNESDPRSDVHYLGSSENKA